MEPSELIAEQNYPESKDSLSKHESSNEYLTENPINQLYASQLPKFFSRIACKGFINKLGQALHLNVHHSDSQKESQLEGRKLEEVSFEEVLKLISDKVILIEKPRKASNMTLTLLIKNKEKH